MKNSLILCLALGIGGLTSCSTEKVGTKHSNLPSKFIDPANLDTTFRPGNNFFAYANGNWMKNNPIPAKETRWGSFNELREFNAQAIKSLLEEAVKQGGANPEGPAYRVGAFYKSAMDSIGIENKGATPIESALAQIDSIQDIQGVIQEAASQRTKGLGSPLFGFYIGQDRKNVSHYIPQISQGGITLPDRDYYLQDNHRNQEVKKAYQTYVTKLFSLVGTNEAEAEKKFQILWNLEKELAAAQKSRVEMRNPHATYNKFSIADFSKQTLPLDWEILLPIMEVEGADSLLVNNPDFFKKEAALLSKHSYEEWKVYLKWNILKETADLLDEDFVKANFAFTKALTGQKEITPRWQRSYQLIDRGLGDLLGQLYVEKYFTPEAKERMDKLVKNLSETFASRIENLDWMSAETKEKALEKLHAFTPKIGYTDKWKTYDSLEIKEDDFFGNVIRSREWAYQDMVNQFGKPVDRTRWGMTPPTVNAYYNAVNNEIAFPAGILQFPFFAFEADDAINYGAIGAVIGHEMTHGFDDSGSQYAADGNLKNWWTEKDAENFKAKANQVVEQYNAYTVLDSIPVNGKLTLGENLADLGGLAIAYAAFKKTPQGQSTEKIDGFTPDQRFFLSWAQVWRMNVRPETAAQLILTDPHSPGHARTIGPLVNMDAWYAAFDVQPTDSLYVKPENRIKVW